MVKIIKSIIGYFLAGFIVTFFWGYFIDLFGIYGSWPAALILVGTSWYINHYLNLASYNPKGVFIDMGLAIAVTNIVVSSFDDSFLNLFNSTPTLFFLGIGAIAGGKVSLKLKSSL